LLSGVASWRGWTVQFTDGICDSCLVRFRAEHERHLLERAAAAAQPTPVRPPQASRDLVGADRPA
jgi:hypothetical protein